MLQLSVRTNKLLSIQFRSISLDFQRYILQVQTNEGKSYFSTPTDPTMLPKFDLDITNKELARYLSTTSDPLLKFILMTGNTKIDEFSVDMGELFFICNDMSKARIKSYPIILFEFTEGFYTTKDLYIHNIYNFNQDSSSITMTPSHTAKLKLSDKKTTQILNTHTISKKEISFVQYNEKMKQLEFFMHQNDKSQMEKSESKGVLNNKLYETHKKYEKIFVKYEQSISIQKMRSEIMKLEEKISLYDTTIQSLKKIISQKQSDLHISSSILQMNRRNYEEKRGNIEKNYKKLEKYKIMQNAFVNKKLGEVAFCFFNKGINKFYTIPPFYNQKFDSSTKIIRYQYYEKYTKELGIMMGDIAGMVNYLSKLFNITLKYPLFINGSKTFIVKDKKDFIALYSVPKNEERHLKFEYALVHLQENFKEILSFFKINSNVTEYEEGISSFNLREHVDNNVFNSIMEFNRHISNNIMKNKLIDDFYHCNKIDLC